MNARADVRCWTINLPGWLPPGADALCAAGPEKCQRLLDGAAAMVKASAGPAHQARGRRSLSLVFSDATLPDADDLVGAALIVLERAGLILGTRPAQLAVGGVEAVVGPRGTVVLLRDVGGL